MTTGPVEDLPTLYALGVGQARIGEQLVGLVNAVEDLRATGKSDNAQLYELLLIRMKAMDTTDAALAVSISDFSHRVDKRMDRIEDDAKEATRTVEKVKSRVVFYSGGIALIAFGSPLAVILLK